MSVYRNRFERNRKNPFAKLAYLLPFAAFLMLFVLFYGGIRSVSDTATDKQRESLETALSRSITQCYAVEGAYPPSLQYIKDHYGLIYNEELFYVDYQPIGANIMPDVTILNRTGGSQ
ncbi:MAG: hypothetical protein UFG06_11965 [Lachnospiraceae bacterium]|nr:hypothetical protein [Lachnospiraceae bacterium]